MAQDRELDQLKDEQDRAFERKQGAWQRQDDAWRIRKTAQDVLDRSRDRQQAAHDVQQRAWERRRSAQDDTSRAFEAKQAAHQDQQAAWDELQRLRDTHGPRIGALRDEHNDRYQRIEWLSKEIENAFSWGNKDEAFEKIEEVKQLRSDNQDLPPQWRELSAEINEAKEVHARAAKRFQPLKADFVRLRGISDEHKAHHEQARADFKEAQAACRQAQAEFESLKTEHERLRDEFRVANQEAERTKEAFSRRLDELRAEQLQRKDDKRSLAQQAGVPSQYWDDVWVSTDEDGNVNLYFGGIGEPAGEGHGHYAMDATGYVTYRRGPFDPHGAQNFTDYEEHLAAPPIAEDGNWYSKYRNDDETIHLMVDKDGNPTTDYPHVHVIHDEKRDQIRVVASYGPNSHTHTMRLSGNASGNDVNAAVEEMRRRL